MSQSRALNEMERFLSTANPEVLSISGRWGVGKTYAWDKVLSEKRATIPLRHYSYVSVFGIKNLDDLKTAIVQSTVSLDGEEIEPTVRSFKEHMSSFEGVRKLAGAGARLAGESVRKSLPAASKMAGAIPYVGKLADLLTPGAALLIRNQIVCIDDIERAGSGLDVTDILGLVTSLRDRKNCKVVLLLNEDGLGHQEPKYREYLEKAVDQAVQFDPTPQESGNAALDATDPLTGQLADRVTSLGITNIRVIRRIRRFLGYVEPSLAGLHDGVTEAVINSIALLGWCVFEPKLAPDLERVRGFKHWAGLIGEDNRSDKDKHTDMILRGYGFGEFDDVDEILLDGLRAGSFDMDALTAAMNVIDRNLQNYDVQAAIGRPWTIFRDSLNDNTDEFVSSLSESIEKYGNQMSANHVTSSLDILRDLGRCEDADRLTQVYIDAQAEKPREFFQSIHSHFVGSIDPVIKNAFEARLAKMPLERDPAVILLDINRKKGWSQTETQFLASVSVDEYRALLKRLVGSELHVVIATALNFGNMGGVEDHVTEIGRRMEKAVQQVAGESRINQLRLKDYLRGNVPQADSSDGLAQPAGESSAVEGEEST